MKKQVILINGAPNSGKDTVAKIMQQLCGYGKIAAFKDQLYVDTAEYFGIDFELFKRMATDRILKETKTRMLQHKSGKGWFTKALIFLVGIFSNKFAITPREALIFVSEKVVKPVFGDDCYGQKLLDTILGSDESHFFIPDSGFVPELFPLTGRDDVECLVIRLHRDGCDFSGDSRRLLTDEELNALDVKFEDIYNDGDLAALEDKILDAVVRISLNKFGVKV